MNEMRDEKSHKAENFLILGPCGFCWVIIILALFYTGPSVIKTPCVIGPWDSNPPVNGHTVQAPLKR